MNRTIHWLARGAAVALLAGTTALTLPVAAETPDASGTVVSTPQFQVTISGLKADGSNLSDADLTAILGGHASARVGELATLNAKSIHIAKIEFTYKLPDRHGAPMAGSFSYNNVTLDDVTAGVAGSLSIGNSVSRSQMGPVSRMGETSAQAVDIGAMLDFVGSARKGAEPQPFKTLYKNFDAKGGTITAPDASCTIGEITQKEMMARPLPVSMGSVLSLVSEMGETKAPPSPETIGKLVSFYTGLLNSFKTTPMTLASIKCSGKDKSGTETSFSAGPITMDGFGNDRYPAVTTANIKIASGTDGTIAIAKVVFKGFDFSNTLAELEKAAGHLTSDWFTANARKLIPAFAGFSIAGVNVDMPDPKSPDNRIKGTMGDFDLSLADYTNGVPASVATSARHIVFDLPKASSEPAIANLEAMGISTIDAGFDLDVKRDAATKTIAITKLAVHGQKLGSLALSGTLGNAGDGLFASDPDTALLAATQLTVKDLKLDVKDEGMSDLVLKELAAKQKSTPATLRTSYSMLAQGMIALALGGTADAKALGTSIASFLGGAKSLSVDVTAKNPAGLDLEQLQALQSDPTSLGGKVKIEASAK